MKLSNFSSKATRFPRLEKPTAFDVAKPSPLAQNPVVARIRKTQFGSSDKGNPTPTPTGVNTNELQDVAASLLKRPKLAIHKL